MAAGLGDDELTPLFIVISDHVHHGIVVVDDGQYAQYVPTLFLHPEPELRQHVLAIQFVQARFQPLTVTGRSTARGEGMSMAIGALKSS